MATVNLPATHSTLLASDTDLIRQRRQAWFVKIAFAVFVLGGPFVTFVHVSSVESRSSGGGAHIHLHALAFGLPLLAAFFASNSFRGFRIRFAGSHALDWLAALMLLYWFAQGVHGFTAGNGLRPVISNGFSFSVPMLTYFALRNLDYPGLMDRLSKTFLTICLWSIVPNVIVTFYAVGVKGFVGAGGVAHLLPVAAATVVLLSGRNLAAAVAFAGALATILASLKRVIWGGVIVYPILYLWVIQRTEHIFKFILAAAVLLAMLVVFEKYLPEQLQLAGITSRVESIYNETRGFSSGQSRQDEIIGIWEETVVNGSWANVLFGRGIGASYTYYTASTQRLVIYEYRNSHFTPMGWLLRGGFVGMILNLTFYGAAAMAAIHATREATAEDRIWVGALTAYFLIAVALSATAFSLTPNAATHMALMAVLVRSAAQRRQAALHEAAV